MLELHDHWPSRETLLLAVRSAFARGELALGGRLVERALAAGVSWDQVASAVAQGIGEHPRWGRPRPIEPADEVPPPEAHASSAAACPGWRPRAGRALAAAGLLALGLVALEAAFGLAALLLQLISSLGAPLARAFPFADPIYTRAAFESLGYAVPVGLGVGDRWPLEVTLAPGAGALATGLAAAAANAVVLALALRRGGWAGRVLAGVVAAHLALVPPTPWAVEASGLSFALGVLAPQVTGRSFALTDLLQPLPAPLQAGMLVAAALGSAWMLARLCAPRARSSPWPLLGLASLAAVGVTAATPAPDWRPAAPPADAALAQDSPPPPSAPVAALSAPSPVPAGVLVPTLSAEPPTAKPTLAPASSSAPAPSPASSSTAATAPSPSSSPTALAAAAPRAPPVAEPAGPTQPLQPTPTPVRAAGPSRVQAITHSLPESRFEYRVNGQRQVIRGMGYNARYAHLPPERRARRMQRDFARMAAAGVNTVQGWDMQLFDEVLLDAAAMNGLGVILPFELDPELNYRDRGVRARLMAKIEAWVQRYRDHPALRMWALGNEVLHKMIRPTWLGGMRDKPEHIARARAFSDFLLAAAQRVWDLDPNHPLTYREAESGYLVWLREAMIRRQGMPENLVLGTNAYTSALQETVEGWPELWMTVPLYVSEFGAAGLGPGERSAVLRRMWGVIRAWPQWTFGGAVYVWTTDGPEEVDRVFGLVDGRGIPVDDALATIAELYRAEAER